MDKPRVEIINKVPFFKRRKNTYGIEIDVKLDDGIIKVSATQRKNVNHGKSNRLLYGHEIDELLKYGDGFR